MSAPVAMTRSERILYGCILGVAAVYLIHFVASFVSPLLVAILEML